MCDMLGRPSRNVVESCLGLLGVGVGVGVGVGTGVAVGYSGMLIAAHSRK